VPFARASSLDRLLKCAGDAILDGGVDTRSPSTLVAADWGTMGHGWKETGRVEVVNGRKSLVPLMEKKIKLSGIKREQWWPETMRHEIALAVKPGEAYATYEGTREEKEAWKAAQSDEWATGTLDGYDWMFDVLWVDDLKTGRFVSLEEYQEQLRFYALGAARLLDYRGPVYVTLTHWPRYPVINEPSRFGRTIEQDELLAFEKRLSDLRDRILRARESKKIELVAGEHCTFCRSKTVCPEVGRYEGN
jgi:hypothetical protein